MPNAEFFQKLGLFAKPAFLDAADCRRVRAAMDEGRRADATVGTADARFEVDPSYRRTKVVDVGDEMRAEIKARMLAIAPDLEAHYGVALTDCQRPQFLAYGSGDYYKAHRDSTVAATSADLTKARKVSAVVFLNVRTETPQAGCYGGGALTFYELFDDPAGRALGLPLDPEPGLLITFTSGVLHAVLPVTHGERCTIVSWYL